MVKEEIGGIIKTMLAIVFIVSGLVFGISDSPLSDESVLILISTGIILAFIEEKLNNI